jgi:hypothetical protein
MIKRLFFFTLLFSVILTGCVAKKTTTEYKEIIKTDSIYITKNTVIVERVLDSILIESPCDSLGNLKPFSKSLVLPQGKIKLFNDNGAIAHKIDLKAYEKTLETKYKLKYDKEVSKIKKSIVIYRTPFWVWIVMLIEGLMIFVLVKY